MNKEKLGWTMTEEDEYIYALRSSRFLLETLLEVLSPSNEDYHLLTASNKVNASHVMYMLQNGFNNIDEVLKRFGK